MNFIKEFIEENKEFKREKGIKLYIHTWAKIIGYGLVNPIITFFLFYYGYIVLAIIMLLITFTGFLFLIAGKMIMESIMEYKVKKLMNKVK